MAACVFRSHFGSSARHSLNTIHPLEHVASTMIVKSWVATLFLSTMVSALDRMGDDLIQVVNVDPIDMLGNDMLQGNIDDPDATDEYNESFLQCPVQIEMDKVATAMLESYGDVGDDGDDNDVDMDSAHPILETRIAIPGPPLVNGWIDNSSAVQHEVFAIPASGGAQALIDFRSDQTI